MYASVRLRMPPQLNPASPTYKPDTKPVGPWLRMCRWVTGVPRLLPLLGIRPPLALPPVSGSLSVEL